MAHKIKTNLNILTWNNLKQIDTFPKSCPRLTQSNQNNLTKISTKPNFLAFPYSHPIKLNVTKIDVRYMSDKINVVPLEYAPVATHGQLASVY
jgi:hypothetical protein